MVEKIVLWETYDYVFAKANLSELALMCEPPDMKPFIFYYKDLAPEQLKTNN
jgi:hypothetical protein